MSEALRVLHSMRWLSRDGDSRITSFALKGVDTIFCTSNEMIEYALNAVYRNSIETLKKREKKIAGIYENCSVIHK